MYNKYFTMKRSQLKEAIKNEIKSVLSEDFNDDNRGLAQIKSSGETDGAMSIRKELKREAFKNVPDMEAYADGFIKGAADVADYLKSKLGQAIRGGGDEESLMGLVGLKEGTWSSGTYNEIGRFIQDVKNLKDKYYDIVGSDDVFDGLDRAEEAAREMMINAPENRSDLNEDEPEDDMHDDPGDIRIDHDYYTENLKEEDEPTSAELKKKDSVATISNKLQKLTAKMKDKAKEFKAAEGEAKEKIKDELKDMTAEKKELEKSL